MKPEMLPKTQGAHLQLFPSLFASMARSTR